MRAQLLRQIQRQIQRNSPDKQKRASSLTINRERRFSTMADISVPVTAEDIKTHTRSLCAEHSASRAAPGTSPIFANPPTPRIVDAQPSKKADFLEAGQLVTNMQFAVRGCNIDQIPVTVRKVLETGAWQTYWQSQRLKQFATFREFILAGPMEGGCSFDPKYVQALLHKSGDAVVEAMFRRAMTAPVGTNQHSDNVTTLKPERGNSRAYTLDRLQREQPELFAQVEAGKLSTNAAAIEAGWRRKLTPFERVQKLLPDLTAEQRRWLREALSKETELTSSATNNMEVER
jgi:hypothetical protein